MAEPKPGQVFIVGEADYRFGLGDLRVEITEVIDRVNFGESGRVELWWHVAANTKPVTDTYPWSGNPRKLYLRDTALRSPAAPPERPEGTGGAMG